VDDFNFYTIGAWITGIISFLAIWIYAFASWGLLLGLMFGWIPALIGGVILGFLWPLVVVVVGALIILLKR
jgi:hypothetical protein